MLREAKGRSPDKYNYNSTREIEEFLGMITEKIKSTSELRIFHPSNDQVNKVVFEVEVDDICYILLCSQPRVELHSLRPREQEIASLVAKGLPNKVIAQILGISVWTVSAHLRRIFAKLDVTRRSAMIARVLEDGLIKNGRPKK